MAALFLPSKISCIEFRNPQNQFITSLPQNKKCPELLRLNAQEVEEKLIKEVIHALCQTIIYHRALGPVTINFQTCETMNKITYVSPILLRDCRSEGAARLGDISTFCQ